MEQDGPEKVLESILNKVEELISLSRDLFKTLEGMNVSTKFNDRVKAFQAQHRNYVKVAASGDYERIIQAASSIALSGSALGAPTNAASGLTEEQKKKLVGIRNVAQVIRNEIDARPTKFSGDPEGMGIPSVSIAGGAVNYEAEKLRLKALADEYDRQSARHQKGLSDNSRRLEELSAGVESLEESLKRELDKVKALYDSAEERFGLKEAELNELLGRASSKAIAGGFAESAVAEKRMADIMRWVSISCMGVVVLILASSLLATLSQEFDWKASVFRAVLAVLLSVPSAYLARESAKHRNLHNLYLQTSLELRTINPYLASLPVEEQNKIKSEVAGRIFGSQGRGVGSIDSYPINLQEIVMALVKRVEIKGKE
jgi:hypothetical protein